MIQKLKSIMAPVESLFYNYEQPDYCELVVTEKCFFRCKMCEMWKRKQEDQPTLQQWKDFVKAFRQTIDLPYKISIVGGETLTYPYLCELIDYCTELGFDVSITTNGFLLNKKVAEKLYTSGLREVVLSLDSHNPEIHDKIRGINGSYKKIIEAIEHLSQYEDMSINLISVIMSLNQGSLPNLVKWSQKNSKINSINFNAITEPLATKAGDDWYENSDYAYLWPDKEVMDELISLKKENYKIGNPLSQLLTFKKFFQYPEKFVKKGSCHMGRTVSVNSEGHVFMCHYYGSIGNIKNDDFKKSWNSKTAKRIRKQILDCNKNCKMLINCNFKE